MKLPPKSSKLYNVYSKLSENTKKAFFTTEKYGVDPAEQLQGKNGRYYSFNKLANDLREFDEIARNFEQAAGGAQGGQTNNTKDNTKFSVDESTEIDNIITESIVNAWGKNFPNVSVLSTIASMRNHKDYEAAKAGDVEAAERLVEDFLDNKKRYDKIMALKEKYPNAIIVGVHAQEANGKNAIPQALAKHIGAVTGLQVDENIAQRNSVKRTGKDKDYRMQKDHQPVFGGKVEAGREYILVDDAVTMGGTFGALNKYIKDNGGKVVDLVSIGAAQFSSKVAISKETLLDLLSNYAIIDIVNELKERGLYDEESQTAGRAASADVDGRGVQGTTSGQEENIGTLRQDGGSIRAEAPQQIRQEEIAFLTEAQARAIRQALNAKGKRTETNTSEATSSKIKESAEEIPADSGKGRLVFPDAAATYLTPEHKQLIEQALKQLSLKIFGDANVFTYDKFIDKRGRIIGGFNFKNLIGIASSKNLTQAQSTFYHEAMHKAIHLFLNNHPRRAF